MSRILILANSSGGLYDFRNGLLTHFLEEGHEVVCSLPDEVRTAEIRAEGCRVVHTDIDRRGMNPAEDFKLLQNYRRLLKNEHPDLVITYTIKPNIYGGYLCGKMNIPQIATITGLGSTFERGGMTKKLIVRMYRTGLRSCACLFFQNTENMEIFRNLGITGRKNVLVGGSGVDLARHAAAPFPGHEGSETRFLYIGRLMREKGTEEYLGAAERMHEKYGKKVSFCTIGYSDESSYREKVEKAQQEGYLTVIPFQKDIAPYLSEADAVVLPSYHEGMSNVLMEAAATARPVLATDISGCRELVEDGSTGFLFSPRSTEALFGAMCRFMETAPEERAAMGRRGREKMEREFDRSRVIAGYAAEAERLLRGE